MIYLSLYKQLFLVNMMHLFFSKLFNYCTSEMQAEQNKKGLTKLEITDHFAKIFEQQQNTSCFQCGKKSKQWAEAKHGIFLCLSCAANYKDLGRIVQVKSISLDLWTQKDLGILRVGGNQRFKDYLRKYQLNQLEPKVFLRTTAAYYYRQNLLNQISGRPILEDPSIQLGKKMHKEDVPITDMSSDEILQQAKQKLFWFGGKTKQYGTKAYTTVQQKVQSGELKQDAQKVGKTVSATAKNIWGFMQAKYEQIAKKQGGQRTSLKEKESREPDSL